MIQKCSLFIFTILFLLTSACVPQSAKSTRKKISSAKTDDNTKVPTDAPNSSTLYWYAGNQNTGNTLQINEDTTTVAYLRGKEIHDFLGTNSNMSKVYCMVASYNSSSAAATLRVRAIPISFPNVGSNTIERLFRVDFPESSTSSSVCDGSTLHIITNAENSTATSVATYSLPDLCPSCRGVITSTNISLYESISSSLTTNQRIAPSFLDTDTLSLRVDTASNTTGPTGSCSLSSCLAKGFDCCLDGQCVHDGAMRPNANSQSDFNQALIDIQNNPANFINWPNIYYICGNRPQVIPTPTPFPNAQETANAFLQEQIKKFNCLEEGKNTSPDFAGNQVCEPSFNQTSYEAIRSTVWAECGCSAIPFPTDPDDPLCPDFGLKAIRDLSNNITAIECDIPPVTTEPTPFQNLSLNVPARSAPHRFFRVDNGEPVDDLSTYTETVAPEGTPFSYLDPSGKTDPDNGTFNMNSLIGQFSLDQSGALPAKVVNLDFDQTYIIATIRGFYSPCPSCAADSWFRTFSAHPSSSQGTGLNAIGYSTDRSNFDNNISYGNYADTSFGRACWLPPTMIPLTHQKESSSITQRRNRLETQSALYVNGYQKDWFGFNKGALIGSFDGVTWFSIGKSRRVTATSSKLFLALNQPYADLANPTDLTVQILLDNSNTTAPSFDYDPNLSPDDNLQNTGASCQYWHFCDVDRDCVTRLGWEYRCVDTTSYRSHWPKFDIDGNEKASEEFDEASIDIILQGIQPTGGNKRCMYRGSGSLCKKNITTLPTNQQKMFACGPNFYCADLNSSEFSTEVARSPNQLDSLHFGQEANVLGRPLHYLDGNGSLTATVKSNILYNLSYYSNDTSDFGVCRPGKSLSSTFLQQHNSKDNSGRTDYINQISSCNSKATGTSRTVSCPVFEVTEDATTEVGDLLLSLNTTKSNAQNMCGEESQRLQGGINVSSFDQIELGKLSSISSILEPGLVADACYRRAGSVCHTNLDCSPNYLHENQAIFFGKEYFGNTDAELKFWQEGLICGQTADKPLPSDSDYFLYDMSKNRCCREIGKEFTMFAQDDDELATDHGLINTGLVTSRYPSNDPTIDGRYSRYASAGSINGNPAAAPNTIYSQAPLIQENTQPKAYQWKSYADTGEATCCGGGWVRKFSDGGHDWTNNSRITFDINDFQCLNYSNELVLSRPPNVDSDNYARDYSRLCLSPGDSGCVQQAFPDPSGFGLTNPSNFSVAEQEAVLSTKPLSPPGSENAVKGIQLSVDIPYEPIPYANAIAIDPDDNDGPHSYFRNGEDYTGVSFYLPIYIGYLTGNNDVNSGGINNLIDVEIVYVDSSKSPEEFTTSSPTFDGACAITNNPEVDMLENQWCIRSEGGSLVFHARAYGRQTLDLADDALDNDSSEWEYAFVKMRFKVHNRDSYLYGLTAISNDPTLSGMKPGNDLYYLTKLARFELLGIPQIYYEPIYCNSNRSKLVPDLFNLPDNTRTSFDANSFINQNNAVNGRPLHQVYDSTNAGADVSNSSGRIVFQDKVALGSVFSSSEFQCCVKAGAETSSAARCCSNFSSNINGKDICKIPSGVDLNVYFNRFVSGEGIGADLPSGGFEDEDFVPETGEPKLTQKVYDKIQAIGQELCASSAVSKGGAFGYFLGEPNSGFYQQENSDLQDSRRYSILDSHQDADGNNNTGAQSFIPGFRWDHHFYCQ